MTNFIIKEDQRELEVRSEELVLYFYISASKGTIQRVSGTVLGTNLKSEDGIRYTKSGRGKIKNASTVGALIEEAEDHLRKNNYYFS